MCRMCLFSLIGNHSPCKANRKHLLRWL